MSSVKNNCTNLNDNDRPRAKTSKGASHWLNGNPRMLYTENNYCCLQRPSHYNVASNYHCANYHNQYRKAWWTEEISTNFFLNEPQPFQGINCN